MSVKITTGAISAIADGSTTLKDIGILVARGSSSSTTPQPVESTALTEDEFNKQFKLGDGSRGILDNNSKYSQEFLDILWTYYQKRYLDTEKTKKRFEYGHDTPSMTKYQTSNQIDCSYYILQGVRGIPYEESIYVHQGGIVSETYVQRAEPDTTTDGSDVNADDTEIVSDGENTEAVGTGIGRYVWALDPDEYYRKKVPTGKVHPIRTASQMLDWMEDMGWGIDFDPLFGNLKSGDIVFWAKNAGKSAMAKRVINYYTDEFKGTEGTKRLNDMSFEEKVNVIKRFDPSVSVTTNMLEYGESLGLPILSQPNRYKHISHVAVVRNVYDNDGSRDVDLKYPKRHSLLEVSTFAGIVINSTLEKRYPDKVVAVCRPQWNHKNNPPVEPFNSSLGLAKFESLNDVDYPGFYYLTSAITENLPTGVSSGLGLSLEVKASYYSKNKPYSFVQILYNTRGAGVWYRAQYTYTNPKQYVFDPSKWTAWTKVV